MPAPVQPGPHAGPRQAVSQPSDGTEPQGDWACTGYRPWKYIVIHHSSTPGGSAASFDLYHRSRGFDELGYHFVVTNGNGGPDGAVEAGRRWRLQKWGSHTATKSGNEYNNLGIGICVVGDFNASMPTARQLASLTRLVAWLSRAYSISPENVIGHRDAPGAATDCPGDRLHAYVHGVLRGELPSLASSGSQARH